MIAQSGACVELELVKTTMAKVPPKVGSTSSGVGLQNLSAKHPGGADVTATGPISRNAEHIAQGRGAENNSGAFLFASTESSKKGSKGKKNFFFAS